MAFRSFALLCSVGAAVSAEHPPITDHSGYEVPFTKQIESKREQIWDKDASSILAKMKSVKPVSDDRIVQLVSLISAEKTEYFATMMSGENPDSQLFTRNSRSSSNTSAVKDVGGAIEYVSATMKSYGFDVMLHDYMDDYPPNLVATLTGTTKPDEIVILGAHLDDRDPENNGVNRAPGANDDGAGTSSLLAAAYALTQANAKFERTLVFEWYTGEEQGLVGSRAIAKKRSEDGDKVFAQIQQDMTGVVGSGDSLGLAFVQDGRAVSTDLTAYVEELASVYADPKLTLHHEVLSGSACCSDHQSYAENGFLSVGLIEPRGYTGDPQYHKQGDLVHRDEYSPEQIALSSRVAMAAAATLAGLDSVDMKATVTMV